MSTETSLWASADFELAPPSPPPLGVRHRLDDPAQTFTLRLTVGAQRMPAWGPLSATPPVRAPFEGPLPLNEFLKDLNREKRRSERSKEPLSLVLYQVDDKTARDSQHAAQLVELLHSSKRVTDFLGHVGSDKIAVLCPDTDGQGIKGFMQKIDSRAGDLHFVGVAATYPDELFDNIANGKCTRAALVPFLASDATERRDSGYSLKRGLDIVSALMAICLLAPLMLVVAAIIATTSRGPIIFRQTRVGKGGAPFTFYKFRSMVTDVDDSIHREYVASLIKSGDAEGSAANGKRPTYKLKADPRVTPIGRLIRKTSVDELPQFFNVLKGDMSLVGPRPPIPYEAAQYQPWHLRRVMTLKPGITGIWQVEGRSRVPFNEMVRMDLRYIRECSLALDLKILLRTVAVVVRGEGAD